MNWKDEWKILALMSVAFVTLFYLPVGDERFDNAIIEALYLTKWYAREHVLLCLIPAFFIAGAIAVFLSEGSVIKYLGVGAKKVMAYGVASVSGTVLAVCSCTVMPLFAGIYKMGAGLGPASTFLYSGPAINVLAIILTARVLGLELGVARTVGAIVFGIVIGLAMHFIFLKEEITRVNAQAVVTEPDVKRPLWQNGLFFFVMVAILVFANWGKPDVTSGAWYLVYSNKWIITAIFSSALVVILILWFSLKLNRAILAVIPVVALALIFPHEPLLPFAAGVIGLTIITSTDRADERTESDGQLGEWFYSSWGFAKQILPLLLLGVLVAGALLGRPGEEGLIPSRWVADAVGGNSVSANLFASVAGAFMYFATLTEVPILQGLLGAGMGKGPALSLLLSGPALSLPNMLVIRSVMGTKKTTVYILLVVVMSTICGIVYGNIF